MADIDAEILVVMGIILFIVVGAFYYMLLSPSNTVQAGGYTLPQQTVNCKTNSNCNSDNPLCISFGDQPTFCGCLDDTYCDSGKNCVYNRCV